MKIATLGKKLEKAGFTFDKKVIGTLGGVWEYWKSKDCRIHYLDGDETRCIIVDSNLALSGGLNGVINCPVDNTRSVCSTWPSVEKSCDEIKSRWPLLV